MSDLYAYVGPKAEESIPLEVKENIKKKIEEYLDGIIQ